MNEKVIQQINENKALVSVEANGNCEKLKALQSGQLSLLEFLMRMSERDPYKLIYMHEDKGQHKYKVVNKNVRYSIEIHVSPENIEKLHLHLDTIYDVYPELVGINCKSCSQKSSNFRILNYIVMLGGIDRDLEKLKGFLDEYFLEKLKQQKPNLDMFNQIALKGSDSYVKQCMGCVQEHIAKAIILLLEYQKDPVKYKSHYSLAIGNLGLAEDECISLDRNLMEKIRKEKLALKENKNYLPNLQVLLD